MGSTVLRIKYSYCTVHLASSSDSVTVSLHPKGLSFCLYRKIQFDKVCQDAQFLCMPVYGGCTHTCVHVCMSTIVVSRPDLCTCIFLFEELVMSLELFSLVSLVYMCAG